MLDPTSLGTALRGVSVAYYLVHSMGSAGSFEENDRQSARNFGAAAKAEGVDELFRTQFSFAFFRNFHDVRGKTIH